MNEGWIHMKKKDLVLSYIQRMVSMDNENKLFTTQELVEHFHMQRTNLSSILNQLVKDNKLEKIDGRPVLYRLISLNQIEEYNTVFQRMIGYNGSLKNAIKTVNSELMYPNKNYTFLLIGNSGVGKSFFVKTLFQHLKETKRISSDTKLSKINCKYFMNHENDLINILKDNEFLKQLKNGILFVDNIHLISQDKRSIIYDFITLQSKENFILIFSSEKNVDAEFEKNYFDSMPVIIDFPDLGERSLEERFEIIKDTLKNEAKK